MQLESLKKVRFFSRRSTRLFRSGEIAEQVKAIYFDTWHALIR